MAANPNGNRAEDMWIPPPPQVDPPPPVARAPPAVEANPLGSIDNDNYDPDADPTLNPDNQLVEIDPSAPLPRLGRLPLSSMNLTGPQMRATLDMFLTAYNTLDSAKIAKYMRILTEGPGASAKAPLTREQQALREHFSILPPEVSVPVLIERVELAESTDVIRERKRACQYEAAYDQCKKKLKSSNTRATFFCDRYFDCNQQRMQLSVDLTTAKRAAASRERATEYAMDALQTIARIDFEDFVCRRANTLAIINQAYNRLRYHVHRGPLTRASIPDSSITNPYFVELIQKGLCDPMTPAEESLVLTSGTYQFFRRYNPEYHSVFPSAHRGARRAQTQGGFWHL